MARRVLGMRILGVAMRGLADASVICRATVAWVLLLSAMFKVRHPGQFRYALDAAFRGWPLSVRDSMSRAVPAVEVSLAGLLLLPLAVSRLASAMAAVLLAGFIVVLARAEPSTGCGCWRAAPGRSVQRVNVARNVLLIALATVGASGGAGAGLGVWMVAIGFGAIAAVVMLELATIVSAVSATRVVLSGSDDL